jgi:hypothetical protein
MYVYTYFYAYVHLSNMRLTCIRNAAPRLMKTLKPIDNKPGLISYADIHAYTSLWIWPKMVASARDLFCPKYASSHWSHNQLQGTASECLSIAPVLKKYFKDVVANTAIGAKFHTEIASLLACIDALETLQYTARVPTSPKLLEQRIMDHLTKYQRAYGTHGWVWKHHASIHLPMQLATHGQLHSCFTQERRHKLVRKYTNDRKTLQSYDVGVVEDCLVQQLFDIRRLDVLRIGLVDARDPSRKELRAVESLDPVLDNEVIKMSLVANVNGSRMKRGDVVILKSGSVPADAVDPAGLCAGELWFLYERNGTPMTCISLWQFADCDGFCMRVRIRETVLKAIPLVCLQCAVVHKRSNDGVCTIVLPPPYRSTLT